MATRPWIRRELPWQQSAPLHLVHSSALPLLERFLAEFDYRRIDLDGRRMGSLLAAHEELARGFGFPDYYGKNWDAFNDCIGDLAVERHGELIAVVWTHVDEMAAASPRTLAEVGWALLDIAIPSPAPSPSFSLDVFMVGDGDEFDRPS